MAWQETSDAMRQEDVPGRETTVIVTEKRTMAVLVAEVVGATEAHRDHFRSERYVVTWLSGHVMGLCEPHEHQPSWKAWRSEDLPILPQPIRWKVTDPSRWEAVRQRCLEPQTKAIICATDAGREGELIFRAAVEPMGLQVPVYRLWVSSMTPQAIAKGLQDLSPWEAYARLGQSALARAWADWWIGMNGSRALSLCAHRSHSAGRVQTPTLCLLEARKQEQESFVVSTHWWIEADFGPAVLGKEKVREGASAGSDGVWTVVVAGPDGTPLHFDGEDQAEQVARDLETGLPIEVLELRQIRFHTAPPRLFSLHSLQQEAFRALGWSARQTLERAQVLYERYGLLSYPRTESEYLTGEDAEELRKALGLDGVDLSAVVDERRVHDHPAIVPTGALTSGLKPELVELYELVRARVGEALAPPKQGIQTQVFLGNLSGTRLYGAWRSFDPHEGVAQGLGELREGDLIRFLRVELRSAQSKPPPSYDESTLLSAMVERGLGTAATRADVLEHLIVRGYVSRDNSGVLEPTLEGRSLARIVPPLLASSESSADLERSLRAIEQGTAHFERVIDQVRAKVFDLVQQIFATSLGHREEWDTSKESVLKDLGVEDEVILPAMQADLQGLEPMRREGLWEATEDHISFEPKGPIVVRSPWLIHRYALARWLDGPLGLAGPVDGLVRDEVMQLRQLGVRAMDTLGSEAGAGSEIQVWFGPRGSLPSVPVVSVSEPEAGAILGPGHLGSCSYREPLGEAWLGLEFAGGPMESVEDRCKAKCEGQLLILSGDLPPASRQDRRAFFEGQIPVLKAPPWQVELRRPLPGVEAIVLGPNSVPGRMGPLVDRVLGPLALGREFRVIVSTSAFEIRRASVPEESLQMVLEPLAQGEVLSFEALTERSGLEAPLVRRNLAELRAVGAVEGDEGQFCLGIEDWRSRYRARNHLWRQDELRLDKFLDSPGCRWQALARGLGQEVEACGLCDRCDPQGAWGDPGRPPSPHEMALIEVILEQVRRSKALVEPALLDALRGRWSRSMILDLAGALVDAGWLSVVQSGPARTYRLARAEPPDPKLIWVMPAGSRRWIRVPTSS